MLTTAGINEAVDLWSNEDSPTAFLYIAYGTGTGAESSGSTVLGTETDRAAATISIVTTAEPSDTRRFQAVFTVASAITISEIAGFNGASAGDMLGRTLIASRDRITTVTNSRIVIIYDFIIGDGGFSGGAGCSTA